MEKSEGVTFNQRWSTTPLTPSSTAGYTLTIMSATEPRRFAFVFVVICSLSYVHLSPPKVTSETYGPSLSTITLRRILLGELRDPPNPLAEALRFTATISPRGLISPLREARSPRSKLTGHLRASRSHDVRLPQDSILLVRLLSPTAALYTGAFWLLE